MKQVQSSVELMKVCINTYVSCRSGRILGVRGKFQGETKMHSSILYSPKCLLFVSSEYVVYLFEECEQFGRTTCTDYVPI